MKNSKVVYIFFLSLVFLVGCTNEENLKDAEILHELPDIFPDINGVTVPYNIAPLNFRLVDECEMVAVQFDGEMSEKTFFYDGNVVEFELDEWRPLLEKSVNKKVSLRLYAKKNGQWGAYDPISFDVSGDKIDEYLVYRQIMPGYQTWNQMAIIQRNLSDFEQKTVIDSKVLPGTCVNCHTFSRNKPNNMMMHLRENKGGTLIYSDDELKKIQTKTDKTFASAGFPYWHPSGKYIAFSVNRVTQIFHATGKVRAHALDMKSDLTIYDVEKNEFFSKPIVNSPDAFEAFPCFSADGKTLFYISAPEGKLPEDQEKMKYSLCSVSFSEEQGALGNKVDTLISASEIGESVSLPRVSPDGRFLMFSTLDYGNFPAYNPESDLWILDLKDGTHQPLEALNSNDVESWHSWSSNGRWVVFSSRRRDGLRMDAWVGYIDENGNAHKPFILPQQNPGFYDEYLYSFNVPELISDAIEVSPYEISNVASMSEGSQADFNSSH